LIWLRRDPATDDTSGFTLTHPLWVDDLTGHEFKVGLRSHFGG